jgi:phosphatidate cytidylyltransferase
VRVWFSQVLLTQVSIFRELVNVRYKTREFHDVPWFRTSQWAWFWASVLYSYGSNFGAPSRRLLVPGLGGQAVDVLRYVDLASLVMYSALLIGFVLTLKAPYYRYQVSQLAWTIAIIVVTVVQVHSFCNNVLNGLFWFLFPVSLVICNDSMAYFFGMAFGKRWIKRPLIGELSPNKTWEGFIGAGLSTLLFAFVTPWVYVQMPFLICPCERLEVFGFSTLFLSCDYPAVFEPTPYQLPSLFAWLGNADGAVTLLPIQLHALIIGTFASVVAPFGGFFASGIKRAFKLDDFGTWVPGHGGVFDRVDCQLIMGFATNTYYRTFIGGGVYSVGTLLALATSLPADDQLALHSQLTTALKRQGLLTRWT